MLNTKLAKKFTQMGQRNQVNRKGLQQFLQILSEEALPEEGSIFIAEMTAIKINPKDLKKRK